MSPLGHFKERCGESCYLYYMPVFDFVNPKSAILWTFLFFVVFYSHFVDF